MRLVTDCVQAKSPALNRNNLLTRGVSPPFPVPREQLEVQRRVALAGLILARCCSWEERCPLQRGGCSVPSCSALAPTVPCLLQRNQQEPIPNEMIDQGAAVTHAGDDSWNHTEPQLFLAWGQRQRPSLPLEELVALPSVVPWDSLSQSGHWFCPL